MNQIVSLKSLLLILLIMYSYSSCSSPEDKNIDLVVNTISIVPLVLGGSEDPLSDGVKHLSFHGYGEIKGGDAQKFWKLFKKKKNIGGFISKGVDMELLVKFEDSTYKKIGLRMKDDSLLYIDYSNDIIRVYELPEESYNLIKSNIIYFKGE